MSKVIFEHWNKANDLVVSLIDYKKPWKYYEKTRIFGIRTNKAKLSKGDTCLDVHVYLGYLVFNFCDYNFQRWRMRK